MEQAGNPVVAEYGMSTESQKETKEQTTEGDKLCPGTESKRMSVDRNTTTAELQ